MIFGSELKPKYPPTSIIKTCHLISIEIPLKIQEFHPSIDLSHSPLEI